MLRTFFAVATMAVSITTAANAAQRGEETIALIGATLVDGNGGPAVP